MLCIFTYIYKIYTQRNIHYVSTFFRVCFGLSYPRQLPKYGSALPLSSVPHIISTASFGREKICPSSTFGPQQDFPGTRYQAGGHFWMVTSWWFFLGVFFVVVDLRNRQFARKREEPEFFWGLGGCGLRCVPPSFFLERKNHLEWVGIFSFLPQLGSFAGSRNTSGRTGSWTLSNMWNKKSNQNLTQIPTTRGSTNSFAGWNEDVFTIQKKWWHFFQPAFGIC